MYAMFTNLVLATEESSNFQILFMDNVTLTGGPNDLGSTGRLNLTYNNPAKNYKLNVDWELFVNGDPKDDTTTRTNPDNLRIDALRVSYIQGDEHFKYGAGIEILGNLGGKSFQNNIHDIVGDSYIPAKYLSDTRVTPTINLEYKNSYWNNNIDFYTSLRMPIVTKNGIVDFQMSGMYVKKDIYQTKVDGGLGLNLDCKWYPDMPEFSGYPLRDFNTCTPQGLVTIGYAGFAFYWQIPLVNGSVQNSNMGISYRF
jgi:hypothetical protein